MYLLIIKIKNQRIKTEPESWICMIRSTQHPPRGWLWTGCSWPDAPHPGVTGPGPSAHQRGHLSPPSVPQRCHSQSWAGVCLPTALQEPGRSAPLQGLSDPPRAQRTHPPVPAVQGRRAMSACKAGCEQGEAGLTGHFSALTAATCPSTVRR